MSPVDGVEPAEQAITLPQGTSQTFSVFTPQPWTHELDVVWNVNGRAVGTDSRFTLDSSTLAAGPHTVEVVIRDRTPFVRHDPAGMLIDGAQWVVTVVRRTGTGQVTMFSGQGQGAGRGSDRSGLTIAGRFIVEGPLDLAAFPATVTITSLFNEAGGMGKP